jgi:hypothetical protein
VSTVKDLHQALSDEVKRLEPPAGLEARVLQQALRSSAAVVPAHRAERRGAVRSWEPKRSMELAAGIATVALAAIVIGTFAYIRLAARPHTVAPPITTASPSPSVPGPILTLPLNVDPAKPLILFDDAGDGLQVDGMTWDGQLGKVTQTPYHFYGVGLTAQSSNPSGTLIYAPPNILDRTGRVVAAFPGQVTFPGTWADDELHYCQIASIQASDTGAVSRTLQLTTPGGTPRDVALVSAQDRSANAFAVTVCSVLADRAVVITGTPNVYGGNGFKQYSVVQLSSGHILWTRDLSGNGVANVVASRDGQYVAEVQSTGLTTIYSATNGTMVAHVNGWVEAFSWDGSLAVVVANDRRTSVLRWSDGTVVWRVPPGQSLVGFQPEPGGPSLAILTSSGASSHDSVLYVVSSGGRVLGQREMPIDFLLGCSPISWGWGPSCRLPI